MSIWAKLASLCILVLAILAGLWKVWHTADKAGYERAQAEAQAVATAQAQRNAELMRAAELRYTVMQPVREKLITQTLTEVRYVTTNLAACVLEPDAVRMLNDAAICASSNSAAACGPGDGLRPPG
jgi:leucyl aminopeptidase (aminopeptidase T)